MSAPAPAVYQAYRRNLTDVIVDSLDDIRRATVGAEDAHNMIRQTYNLVRPWVKNDQEFIARWNQASDRWDQAFKAEHPGGQFDADMDLHALLVEAAYYKRILIRPGLSVDDEELPIGANGGVTDEAAAD